MSLHLRAGVQNHYSHRVRIGNWSEDQDLNELQTREYKHRKAQGSLLVQGIQAHLNKSLQKVGLSYSRDNKVHLGDHVMIFSAETKGVVSVDTSDPISLVNPNFTATTSNLTQGNVARNTFVIEGYGRAAASGSVLKYGQSFRIRVNPALASHPVYLTSVPKSHVASSQISKKQLVSFGSEANFDTVWIAMYGDHNRRFEMEGQPVDANAELVLYHQATRNPLASETKFCLNNDFGPEFELCCYPHTTGKKNHELTQEFRGLSTQDIPGRGETNPNRFAFLTASSVEQEALLNQMPAPQTVDGDALIGALRDTLCNRFGGPGTIIDLGRRFRISDRDKSGTLSMEEFTTNLAQIGFRYSPAECEALKAMFDTDGNNQISYQEFLRAIRGSLSPARLAVVNQAFDKFDRDGSGSVQINDLQGLYDASWHPEVKQGKRTAESVFAEFLSAFEQNVDGNVTREEFVEYYTNLSAFMDTDEYFTTVVRNAWKL